MGQQEVHEFMRENKEVWYTTKQLAKELKVNINVTANACRKLRRSGSLEFVLDTSKPKAFIYRFKR